jgi:HTH-type transcriptional regulator / antitoxin HigA
VPYQDQKQLFDTRPIHPGKILRQWLDEKGWTQDELATITNRRRQTISEIVSGKNGVTPEMAVVLAAAFGNKPEEWLRYDTLYRLSTVEGDDVSDIEKKARLFEIAPIREMQKRGWIKDTDSPEELEQQLKQFFGADSLDDDITFSVAARRSEKLPADLTPAERAWYFRARQMASAIPVGPFISQALEKAEPELRELAAYPNEVRHLAQLLASYGVRFIVIEPLPGVKVDGAAFWCDDGKPAIAISLRYDRIDAFWFTVMHEFAHIKNGDALSVDKDMIDATIGIAVMLVEDEAERRANEQASASLIPPEEFDSFIRRVGPLYSKERIVQFAHKIKIHPGIIVGQLQHRNEIGFSSNREMLVKVRSSVIDSALTDGWNKSITPGLL